MAKDQANLLKVSAVIPTYNRCDRLAAALGSVLQQTRPVDEIVVVDDGSTDNTVSMLEDFARQHAQLRVRVIRLENRGPSAARNNGVSAAAGDLIAFLDDDDIWLPQKLARQLAILEADSTIALMGTATDTLRLAEGARLVKVDERNLIYRNYFLTPSVIARKDAILEAGGFPEDMRHCEDYALWLKIASKHKCFFLNEELVHCGHGKPPFGHSGLSGDLAALHAGELEALARWSKYRDAGCLVTLLAKALARLRDMRRRIIVSAYKKSGNA